MRTPRSGIAWLDAWLASQDERHFDDSNSVPAPDQLGQERPSLTVSESLDQAWACHNSRLSAFGDGLLTAGLLPSPTTSRLAAWCRSGCAASRIAKQLGNLRLKRIDHRRELAAHQAAKGGWVR